MDVPHPRSSPMRHRPEDTSTSAIYFGKYSTGPIDNHPKVSVFPSSDVIAANEPNPSPAFAIASVPTFDENLSLSPTYSIMANTIPPSAVPPGRQGGQESVFSFILSPWKMWSKPIVKGPLEDVSSLTRKGLMSNASAPTKYENTATVNARQNSHVSIPSHPPSHNTYNTHDTHHNHVVSHNNHTCAYTSIHTTHTTHSARSTHSTPVRPQPRLTHAPSYYRSASLAAAASSLTFPRLAAAASSPPVPSRTHTAALPGSVHTVARLGAKAGLADVYSAGVDGRTIDSTRTGVEVNADASDDACVFVALPQIARSTSATTQAYARASELHAPTASAFIPLSRVTTAATSSSTHTSTSTSASTAVSRSRSRPCSGRPCRQTALSTQELMSPLQEPPSFPQNDVVATSAPVDVAILTSSPVDAPPCTHARVTTCSCNADTDSETDTGISIARVTSGSVSVRPCEGGFGSKSDVCVSVVVLVDANGEVSTRVNIPILCACAHATLSAKTRPIFTSDTRAMLHSTHFSQYTSLRHNFVHEEASTYDAMHNADAGECVTGGADEHESEPEMKRAGQPGSERGVESLSYVSASPILACNVSRKGAVEPELEEPVENRDEDARGGTIDVNDNNAACGAVEVARTASAMGADEENRKARDQGRDLALQEIEPVEEKAENERACVCDGGLLRETPLDPNDTTVMSPPCRVYLHSSEFSFFQENQRNSEIGENSPSMDSSDSHVHPRDDAPRMSDFSTTSFPPSQEKLSSELPPPEIPDLVFPELLYSQTLSLISTLPSSTTPLLSLLDPRHLLTCTWAYSVAQRAALHRQVELHAIASDQYWRLQGSAFSALLARVEASLTHVSQVEAVVQLLVRVSTAVGGVLGKRIDVSSPPEPRMLHSVTLASNATLGSERGRGAREGDSSHAYTNSNNNLNALPASISAAPASASTPSAPTYAFNTKAPPQVSPSLFVSAASTPPQPAMSLIATHLNSLQLLLARTNRHMKDSLLVDMVTTLSHLKRAVAKQVSALSSRARGLMKAVREQRDKARVTWVSYKRGWAEATEKRSRWMQQTFLAREAEWQQWLERQRLIWGRERALHRLRLHFKNATEFTESIKAIYTRYKALGILDSEKLCPFLSLEQYPELSEIPHFRKICIPTENSDILLLNHIEAQLYQATHPINSSVVSIATPSSYPSSELSSPSLPLPSSSSTILTTCISLIHQHLPTLSTIQPLPHLLHVHSRALSGLAKVSFNYATKMQDVLAHYHQWDCDRTNTCKQTLSFALMTLSQLIGGLSGLCMNAGRDIATIHAETDLGIFFEKSGLLVSQHEFPSSHADYYSTTHLSGMGNNYGNASSSTIQVGENQNSHPESPSFPPPPSPSSEAASLFSATMPVPPTPAPTPAPTSLLSASSSHPSGAHTCIIPDTNIATYNSATSSTTPTPTAPIVDLPAVDAYHAPVADACTALATTIPISVTPYDRHGGTASASTSVLTTTHNVQAAPVTIQPHTCAPSPVTQCTYPGAYSSNAPCQSLPQQAPQPHVGDPQRHQHMHLNQNQTPYLQQHQYHEQSQPRRPLLPLHQQVQSRAPIHPSHHQQRGDRRNDHYPQRRDSCGDHNVSQMVDPARYRHRTYQYPNPSYHQYEHQDSFPKLSPPQQKVYEPFLYQQCQQQQQHPHYAQSRQPRHLPEHDHPTSAITATASSAGAALIGPPETLSIGLGQHGAVAHSSPQAYPLASPANLPEISTDVLNIPDFPDSASTISADAGSDIVFVVDSGSRFTRTHQYQHQSPHHPLSHVHRPQPRHGYHQRDSPADTYVPSRSHTHANAPAGNFVSPPSFIPGNLPEMPSMDSHVYSSAPPLSFLPTPNSLSPLSALPRVLPPYPVHVWKAITTLRDMHRNLIITTATSNDTNSSTLHAASLSSPSSSQSPEQPSSSLSSSSQLSSQLSRSSPLVPYEEEYTAITCYLQHNDPYYGVYAFDSEDEDDDQDIRNWEKILHDNVFPESSPSDLDSSSSLSPFLVSTYSSNRRQRQVLLSYIVRYADDITPTRSTGDTGISAAKSTDIGASSLALELYQATTATATTTSTSGACVGASGNAVVSVRCRCLLQDGHPHSGDIGDSNSCKSIANDISVTAEDAPTTNIAAQANTHLHASTASGTSTGTNTSAITAPLPILSRHTSASSHMSLMNAPALMSRQDSIYESRKNRDSGTKSGKTKIIGIGGFSGDALSEAIDIFPPQSSASNSISSLTSHPACTSSSSLHSSSIPATLSLDSSTITTTPSATLPSMCIPLCDACTALAHTLTHASSQPCAQLHTNPAHTNGADSGGDGSHDDNGVNVVDINLTVLRDVLRSTTHNDETRADDASATTGNHTNTGAGSRLDANMGASGAATSILSSSSPRLRRMYITDLTAATAKYALHTRALAQSLTMEKAPRQALPQAQAQMQPEMGVEVSASADMHADMRAGVCGHSVRCEHAVCAAATMHMLQVHSHSTPSRLSIPYMSCYSSASSSSCRSLAIDALPKTLSLAWRIVKDTSVSPHLRPLRVMLLHARQHRRERRLWRARCGVLVRMWQQWEEARRQLMWKSLCQYMYAHTQIPTQSQPSNHAPTQMQAQPLMPTNMGTGSGLSMYATIHSDMQRKEDGNHDHRSYSQPHSCNHPQGLSNAVGLVPGQGRWQVHQEQVPQQGECQGKHQGLAQSVIAYSGLSSSHMDTSPPSMFSPTSMPPLSSVPSPAPAPTPTSTSAVSRAPTPALPSAHAAHPVSGNTAVATIASSTVTSPSSAPTSPLVLLPQLQHTLLPLLPLPPPSMLPYPVLQYTVRMHAAYCHRFRVLSALQVFERAILGDCVAAVARACVEHLVRMDAVEAERMATNVESVCSAEITSPKEGCIVDSTRLSGGVDVCKADAKTNTEVKPDTKTEFSSVASLWPSEPLHALLWLVSLGQAPARGVSGLGASVHSSYGAGVGSGKTANDANDDDIDVEYEAAEKESANGESGVCMAESVDGRPSRSRPVLLAISSSSSSSISTSSAPFASPSSSSSVSASGDASAPISPSYAQSSSSPLSPCSSPHSLLSLLSLLESILASPLSSTSATSSAYLASNDLDDTLVFTDTATSTDMRAASDIDILTSVLMRTIHQHAHTYSALERDLRSLTSTPTETRSGNDPPHANTRPDTRLSHQPHGDIDAVVDRRSGLPDVCSSRDTRNAASMATASRVSDNSVHEDAPTTNVLTPISTSPSAAASTSPTSATISTSYLSIFVSRLRAAVCVYLQQLALTIHLALYTDCPADMPASDSADAGGNGNGGVYIRDVSSPKVCICSLLKTCMRIAGAHNRRSSLYLCCATKLGAVCEGSGSGAGENEHTAHHQRYLSGPQSEQQQSPRGQGTPCVVHVSSCHYARLLALLMLPHATHTKSYAHENSGDIKDSGDKLFLHMCDKTEVFSRTALRAVETVLDTQFAPVFFDAPSPSSLASRPSCSSSSSLSSSSLYSPHLNSPSSRLASTTTSTTDIDAGTSSNINTDTNTMSPTPSHTLGSIIFSSASTAHTALVAPSFSLLDHQHRVELVAVRRDWLNLCDQLTTQHCSSHVPADALSTSPSSSSASQSGAAPMAVPVSIRPAAPPSGSTLLSASPSHVEQHDALLTTPLDSSSSSCLPPHSLNYPHSPQHLPSSPSFLPFSLPHFQSSALPSSHEPPLHLQDPNAQYTSRNDAKNGDTSHDSYSAMINRTYSSPYVQNIPSYPHAHVPYTSSGHASTSYSFYPSSHSSCSSFASATSSFASTLSSTTDSTATSSLSTPPAGAIASPCLPCPTCVSPTLSVIPSPSLVPAPSAHHSSSSLSPRASTAASKLSAHDGYTDKHAAPVIAARSVVPSLSASASTSTSRAAHSLATTTVDHVRAPGGTAVGTPAAAHGHSSPTHAHTDLSTSPRLPLHQGSEPPQTSSPPLFSASLSHTPYYTVLELPPAAPPMPLISQLRRSIVLLEGSLQQDTALGMGMGLGMGGACYAVVSASGELMLYANRGDTTAKACIPLKLCQVHIVPHERQFSFRLEQRYEETEAAAASLLLRESERDGTQSAGVAASNGTGAGSRVGVNVHGSGHATTTGSGQGHNVNGDREKSHGRARRSGAADGADAGVGVGGPHSTTIDMNIAHLDPTATAKMIASTTDGGTDPPTDTSTNANTGAGTGTEVSVGTGFYSSLLSMFRAIKDKTLNMTLPPMSSLPFRLTRTKSWTFVCVNDVQLGIWVEMCRRFTCVDEYAVVMRTYASRQVTLARRERQETKRKQGDEDGKERFSSEYGHPEYFGSEISFSEASDEGIVYDFTMPSGSEGSFPISEQTLEKNDMISKNPENRENVGNIPSAIPHDMSTRISPEFTSKPIPVSISASVMSSQRPIGTDVHVDQCGNNGSDDSGGSRRHRSCGNHANHNGEGGGVGQGGVSVKAISRTHLHSLDISAVNVSTLSTHDDNDILHHDDTFYNKMCEDDDNHDNSSNIGTQRLAPTHSNHGDAYSGNMESSENYANIPDFKSFRRSFSEYSSRSSRKDADPRVSPWILDDSRDMEKFPNSDNSQSHENPHPHHSSLCATIVNPISHTGPVTETSVRTQASAESHTHTSADMHSDAYLLSLSQGTQMDAPLLNMDACINHIPTHCPSHYPQRNAISYNTAGSVTAISGNEHVGQGDGGVVAGAVSTVGAGVIPADREDDVNDDGAPQLAPYDHRIFHMAAMNTAATVTSYPDSPPSTGTSLGPSASLYPHMDTTVHGYTCTQAHPRLPGVDLHYGFGSARKYGYEHSSGLKDASGYPQVAEYRQSSAHGEKYGLHADRRGYSYGVGHDTGKYSSDGDHSNSADGPRNVDACKGGLDHDRGGFGREYGSEFAPRAHIGHSTINHASNFDGGNNDGSQDGITHGNGNTNVGGPVPASHYKHVDANNVSIHGLSNSRVVDTCVNTVRDLSMDGTNGVLDISGVHASSLHLQLMHDTHHHTPQRYAPLSQSHFSPYNCAPLRHTPFGNPCGGDNPYPSHQHDCPHQHRTVGLASQSQDRGGNRCRNVDSRAGALRHPAMGTGVNMSSAMDEITTSISAEMHHSRSSYAPIGVVACISDDEEHIHYMPAPHS